MSLHARITVPDRGIDIALSVNTGRVLALLGPNGAGKSTTLSAIAGLLRGPHRGHVEVGGRVVLDTDTGVDVPAHRRGVATLAQDPLLFPHLSVVDNVAFGPRVTGRSRRVARERARRWLAEVDATEFADRTPAQLSGGQAQRVALARALAAEPSVLLLDEPMGALDVGAAPQLRRALRTVLRRGDRTAVIVTHEVLDAIAMADTVAVIEDGSIVEQGPTRDVLAAPRSSFSASLCGLNVVPGTAQGPHTVRVGESTTLTGMPDDGSAPASAAGSAVVALFAPEAVTVHAHPPEGSARTVLEAVVTAVDTVHTVVRVHTRIDGGADVVAAITAAAAADLDPQPGDRVHLAVKAVQVRVIATAESVNPVGDP